MQKKIQLSALGRNVQVGDLYNYFNDEILPTRLDQVSNKCKYIEEKWNSETEINFFFQEQESFKYNMVGINSHLEKSIKQKFIDWGPLWLADYIKLNSTDSGDSCMAQVIVYCKISRRTETLHQKFFDSKLNRLLIEKEDWATHLVEQVNYGAEFICIMQKAIDPDEYGNKETVQENIYRAAETYINLIQTSKPHLTYFTEPPAELDNVLCTIYSSIEIGDVPKCSVEQFRQMLIETISVRNFPEKWRPIDILICDIPYHFRIFMEAKKDFSLNIERKWSSMLREKSKLFLESTPLIEQNPQLQNILSKFSNLLISLRKRIDVLKMKFPTVIGEQMEVLKDIKFVTEILVVDISEWLVRQRSEIETWYLLLKNTLSDCEEIENSLKLSNKKKGMDFVLRMNNASDPLLENIQSKIDLYPTPNTADEKQRLKKVSKELEKFSSDVTEFAENLNNDTCETERTPSSILLTYINSDIEEVKFIPVANQLLNEPIEKDQNLERVVEFSEKEQVVLVSNHDMEDDGQSFLKDCYIIQENDLEDQANTIEMDPNYNINENWTNQDGNRIDLSTNLLSSINTCDKRTSINSLLITNTSNETQFKSCRPLDKRIAEIFAASSEYSRLLKQGQPNVYMLEAKQSSTIENLRRFEIGRPNTISTPDHKVIILMGATGSGKSTLIDGMVNHIFGVQWKDPFRFKIVHQDEITIRNQAHSQTSSVTAYTIYHQEGMTVPYSITIIDTPGYGDTRGVKRDKEITKMIHHFLAHQGIQIDKIHAVCFVAASGDSRLTVTQRYILDSVLSTFGNDIKDNVRLLTTFADNADPPVVEACRAAHFPLTSQSAGIAYSKFNSSVLYASNKQASQQDESDFSFDELFWDMGQENFEKFFIMLKEMQGKDLKITRQVIQHRNILEESLKDIERELEVYLFNMENMEILIAKMKTLGQNGEVNKHFKIEQFEMKLVEVKCQEGYCAYNCLKCKRTCEKPKQICNITEGVRSCEQCPCPPNDHSFQHIQWSLVPEKVTQTFQEMRTKLNCHEKMSTQQFLEECCREVSNSKAKIFSLLFELGTTARSINSTAMRSNALSPADYLSLMRSRVAEEQKPGYLTRLETLAELQQESMFVAPTPPRSGLLSSWLNANLSWVRWK